MLNKKLQKILTNLVQLKINQQDTIRGEIAKIIQEKENKIAEINLAEAQIFTNTNNIAQKKIDFYANVNMTIFSHKEVYGLKIDVEKLTAKHNDLTNKCKSLSDELIIINEKLRERQQQLKTLIIKEEKFKYMSSIAAIQS